MKELQERLAKAVAELEAAKNLAAGIHIPNIDLKWAVTEAWTNVYQINEYVHNPAFRPN